MVGKIVGAGAIGWGGEDSTKESDRVRLHADAVGPRVVTPRAILNFGQGKGQLTKREFKSIDGQGRPREGKIAGAYAMAPTLQTSLRKQSSKACPPPSLSYISGAAYGDSVWNRGKRRFGRS